MNGYKSNSPRTAFGIAAVALSAVTMSAFVLAPATLDQLGDHEVAGLVASANAAPANPPVVYTIDVVGTRDAATPTIEARNTAVRSKHQG
jgi:hypothetical protein